VVAIERRHLTLESHNNHNRHTEVASADALGIV
jgi:hypothetical protein